ncbi:hypothetical protein P152DRAFT_462391 [Eremomyces bilateralis CBS 781.70]|uniref:Glycosyltransferase family 8 protein n=1 Tax=Eremomyces bilateralis CBS 781.70 TaxID=1392243 RepID=A0A6G1FS29_9PEZI|nr:uncharacterized protein P152DRAFT_462391 [Eremomyces bilateralis CBS 781.70]KAF1808528.1 hypothetical protein P152DRAFT_462391 [Eremomyces bilateralis CBS 781.70]
MARILLTSGQVSVALSSGVVVIFTILLFLSGYVLQQQTVRSLRHAIRPPLPPPPPSLPLQELSTQNPLAKSARLPGTVVSKEAVQAHLAAASASQAIDWKRRAHVQLVRSHEEVCGAVMVFADLYRLRSQGSRALVFPAAWATAWGDEWGYETNPEAERTRRLLKKAARRYKVHLVPMKAIEEGGDDSLPSSYSYASLFSLDWYDRILALPRPGVVLDAVPLDVLLAFGTPESLATSAAAEVQFDISPQSEMTLIRPSKEEFSRIMDIRDADQLSETSLFSEAFPSPEKLSAFGNAEVALMATTGSLKEYSIRKQDPPVPEDNVPGSPSGEQLVVQETAGQSGAFNATEFMQNTAFVRIMDAGLPGPEYDVPRTEMLKAKPWGEAGMVWESMYERFRAHRMDVCGLELEMVPEKEEL